MAQANRTKGNHGGRARGHPAAPGSGSGNPGPRAPAGQGEARGGEEPHDRLPQLSGPGAHQEARVVERGPVSVREGEPRPKARAEGAVAQAPRAVRSRQEEGDALPGGAEPGQEKSLASYSGLPVLGPARPAEEGPPPPRVGGEVEVGAGRTEAVARGVVGRCGAVRQGSGMARRPDEGQGLRGLGRSGGQGEGHGGQGCQVQAESGALLQEAAGWEGPPVVARPRRGEEVAPGEAVQGTGKARPVRCGRVPRVLAGSLPRPPVPRAKVAAAPAAQPAF